MLNEVFRPDKHRSLPVPAGTKSGDPLRIGLINGVAVTDRASTVSAAFNADGSPNASYNRGGGNPDGYASVWTWGGHRLNVVAASAPAFGDGVYWDAAGGAGKKLTTTVGTNPLFGAVADPAPVNNGDGTYSVIVDIASPTK